MNQTLDARFDLGKGAKVGDVGDHPFHQLSQFIVVFDQRPGLGLQALAAQGDPLVLSIQMEDDYVYLIADVQQLSRMAETPPAQLRQMDQAVSAANVDKGAKGGQAADDAMSHFALPQLVKQAVALLLAPFALGLG